MNDTVETQATDSSELHLKVKTLQPATYEITTPKETTVHQLKQKLVSLSNIPVERQRLIFRGAVLQDSQGLLSAHIEDGHTLHLVERPENAPPPQDPQQQPQHQGPRTEHRRINIGMIDATGAISAVGGIPAFLQSLMSANGHQQFQMVTHPPAGNREGAPQVVQMVSMSGGPQELAPPHQLRALNNYLLNLETDPPPTTLPPFSMVSRIGQAAADQAAFLEMANAALNGSDLPSNVSDFLQSVQVEPELEAALPPENDATGSQEQAGGMQNPRDPRRNGLDGQASDMRPPRPMALGPDMLRLATLAVAQSSRQALRQLQARSLPAMAAAVNILREQGIQGNLQGPSVYEQARTISNTAYSLGSLMLELSLATSNLAQAANNNAGPLICAQTGFLSGDGSHSHITNRIPSMAPIMGAIPAYANLQGAAAGRTAGRRGGPPSAGPGMPRAAVAGPAMRSQNVAPQNRPGGMPAAGNSSTPQPEAAAAGPASAQDRHGAPSRRPPPHMQTGADYATPLAHAYVNAITNEDDIRARHMRLPVQLAGSNMRLDMSGVVNAVETLILSTPTPTIQRILQDAVPGPEDRSMRELMTSPQTDEQRRGIYTALVEPVLSGLMHHLQSYLQQVYRVIPRQQGSDQPVIRPTTRAANRSVPSLTQPFAMVSNPARDTLRTMPNAGGLPGLEGSEWLPGGHVQVEMVMEGVDLPLAMQSQFGNAAFGTMNPPAAPPSTAPPPGPASRIASRTPQQQTGQPVASLSTVPPPSTAPNPSNAPPSITAPPPSTAPPSSIAPPPNTSSPGQPAESPNTIPSELYTTPEQVERNIAMAGRIFQGRTPNQFMRNAGFHIPYSPLEGVPAWLRDSAPRGAAQNPPPPPPSDTPQRPPVPASFPTGVPNQSIGQGSQREVQPREQVEEPKVISEGVHMKAGDSLKHGDRTEASTSSGGAKKEQQSLSNTASSPPPVGGREAAKGLGASLPPRKRPDSTGKAKGSSMQDPRGKAEGGSQEQQSADPPQGDEKEAKKQRIEQSTVMPGTEEIAGGTQVSASQHLTHASAQQGVRQPAAGQEPGSGDPMAGLLQSGRVHQIAGPSDFGDFLASPAVNRAINALFDDDVSLWSQDTAAAGSPPQNQAFNPASLMQAMLPSGNQAQGRDTRGNSEASGLRSRADAGVRTMSSTPGNGTREHLAELSCLPEEDAERWRQTILADTERMANNDATGPLSSSYIKATSTKAGDRPSSIPDIALLD